MKNFNCLTPGYQQWASRVRDHCQAVNFGWIRILDLTETKNYPLTWELIMRSSIDSLASHHLVELS